MREERARIIQLRVAEEERKEEVRGRGSFIIEVSTAAAPPAAPKVEEERGEREGLFEGVRREAYEELKRLLREQGFASVRLIAFDLPTEYRGSKTRYENEGEGIVERKMLLKSEAEVAAYRTLRRRFYEELERVAFRTKAGWVLLPDANPSRLLAIAAELNKLAGTERSVDYIEVAVPRAWLRGELESYINETELDLRRTAEKLADEAIGSALRRKLARRKDDLEQLLARLKSYLAALG